MGYKIPNIGTDNDSGTAKIPRQCQKASELMMKYMDGSLLKHEAEQLNKHVSDCSSCKEDFLAYDMMMNEFSEIELVPAPEDFLDGVMSKIKALPESSRNVISSIDNIIYAVWGIFSILFGVGFLMFLNKEHIVSMMKDNEAFTLYLKFVTPISTFVTEFVVNLKVVFDDSISIVSSAVSNYRYAILITFAILVLAQYILKIRKNGLDVVFADEKTKKE